jgi:hypothetical protein
VIITIITVAEMNRTVATEAVLKDQNGDDSSGRDCVVIPNVRQTRSFRKRVSCCFSQHSEFISQRVGARPTIVNAEGKGHKGEWSRSGTGCRLRPYTHTHTKQTPWPLVRKRTIPTERPPLVGEI